MNKPIDTEGKPLEIERKFLIDYPDIKWLEHRDAVKAVKITQYYLNTDAEKNIRIRLWQEDDCTRYILTIKTRITDMTRIEEEQDITRDEFERLLDGSAGNRKSISKTRYRFPFKGKTMEVDVFPFWDDKAILEVELEREDEGISLPDELHVIKEVTEDRSYTNFNLAKTYNNL